MSFDNSTRLIAGPKPFLMNLTFSNLSVAQNPFQFHLLKNNPGGDDGTRTRGIRLAKAALSQLSYIPFTTIRVVGLTGLEPVTPALSAQCSNQLSYKPDIFFNN